MSFDAAVGYVTVLLLGLGLIFLLRRSGRAVAVVMFAGVAFVPIWAGLNVIVFWPVATLVCGLVILTLFNRDRLDHWTTSDKLLTAAATLVLAEFALGLVSRTAVFTLLVTWGGAYLAGRLLGRPADLRWIYGAAAIVLGGAAVFALVEAATGFNPFITFVSGDSGLAQTWATVQYRGGRLRAEAAFGHSIALACSMAIGVAMTLGSRLRPAVKIGLLALMGAAAVFSFSRLGMLACALTAAAMLIGNRESNSRRFRRNLIAAGVVAGAIAVVAVQSIFRASGTEASASAHYRTLLLQLVGDVAPFGVSSALAISTSGRTTVGAFGSVDNAALLFALTYGWVPMLLLIPPVAATIIRAAQRRLTPPAAALLGQIPAFFTVALITQYAVLLWLTAGLAVSAEIAQQQILQRTRPTRWPMTSVGGKPVRAASRQFDTGLATTSSTSPEPRS